MVKRLSTLSYSLRAVFVPAIDLPARLLRYENPDFGVYLFAGSSTAGEVRSKHERENAAVNKEELTSARGNGSDEIVNRTTNDINAARNFEREILAGSLSCSFTDGVFDFRRTIHCEDDEVDPATAAMVEYFVLPFLRTLGNLAGFTAA
jgi:hypothetical protein